MSAVRRSRWVRSAAPFVVVALAIWWFSRVASDVDWPAVRDALGHLDASGIAVLLAAVALRTAVNAGPLALLVPVLGLRRAVANDLSATVVATVAPPPTDILLRMSMFRSWGVDTEAGLRGLTLTTVTYYVARFGAPVLGVVIAVGLGAYDSSYAWSAVIGLLVSSAVLALLVIASRGERAAAHVARRLAGILRRVATRVDPEEWAARAGGFVAGAGSTLVRHRWGVVACQVGLLASEALLLVCSLRVVGVPASAASALDIVVALLVAYPLTALPFGGLGVLDAAVLATLGLDAGPWEASAVAGIIVFRTCWILVPMAAGAVTALWWRVRVGRAMPSDLAVRGDVAEASER